MMYTLSGWILNTNWNTALVNNKKMPKGCLMVMADPLDLGHCKMSSNL